MKQTPNLSGHDRWTALILAGFLIAYFGAATVFQIRSEESFWAEGSPLDVMHGCMLWAASSMALMVAVLRLSKPGLAILWLLGSAAIGVVALDELFMLHEHSVKITGDDDHPKMALILSAAFGIWFLNRVETLRGAVLGLPHEVVGDGFGVGGGVGEDEDIGGAGEHVDADAAKEDALGFGDVLIAGTCKDIGAGQAEQAKGHRGDALHAAHRQNAVGAAQVGGTDDCGRQARAGARCGGEGSNYRDGETEPTLNRVGGWPL